MATSPTPEVRKGLPIVAYLVFGVSALVILSVGGVLLVTLSIATRNTVELLEDKSRLLITSVVQEVQLFLAPAHAQVEALARLIESGRLDPADPEQLFGALQAGLAASPHVRSAVFLDPSGWLMAAIRSGRVPLPEVADWRHNLAGRRRSPRPWRDPSRRLLGRAGLPQGSGHDGRQPAPDRGRRRRVQRHPRLDHHRQGAVRVHHRPRDPSSGRTPSCSTSATSCWRTARWRSISLA